MNWHSAVPPSADIAGQRRETEDHQDRSQGLVLPTASSPTPGTQAGPPRRADRTTFLVVLLRALSAWTA